MLRTFNCGIGMIVVISPKDVMRLRKHLNVPEKGYTLGKVTKETGDQRVVYDGILDLG